MRHRPFTRVMAEPVRSALTAMGMDPSREAIARARRLTRVANCAFSEGIAQALDAPDPQRRRAAADPQAPHERGPGRRLRWHLTRAMPGHACPAFVPRTTGRRQETTGTAGASNPQVRNRIRASPQVAKSAPRTPSRWRHGFEPRWDYEREVPGQATSREATRSLNDDSIAKYPDNIPGRIEPSGSLAVSTA